jgi:hypothetical protein
MMNAIYDSPQTRLQAGQYRAAPIPALIGLLPSIVLRRSRDL